jgi:hypothetical protein
MKKLTLKERFLPHEFRIIQEDFNILIPECLKDYLKTYSNLSVNERFFVNKEGKLFAIAQFIDYRMMNGFLVEFKCENLGKKIPFAIDDGGWIFVLSLDVSTEGQILLHQTELEWKTPEEAFEKVSDTFEDFINGLKREEEVF